MGSGGTADGFGTVGTVDGWDPAVRGAYDRLGILGRGAYGVVYHARERSSGVECAVKIVAAGGGDDEAHEAHILRGLAPHANIVAVHRVFWTADAGACCIAMEVCTAGTLEGWMERSLHTRTLEDSLVAFAQLCSGVVHLHGHGILHRDLKPSNAYFTPLGVLKIGDFGVAIAQQQQQQQQQHPQRLRKDMGTGMGGAFTLPRGSVAHPTASLIATQLQSSRVGAVASPAGIGTQYSGMDVGGGGGGGMNCCGTPNYMSPESCEGDVENPKSDVWALGVMLFELVSDNGVRPFDGPHLMAVVSNILYTPAPALPSYMTAGVRDLAKDLLEKDPDLRPAMAAILQRPPLKAPLASIRRGVVDGTPLLSVPPTAAPATILTTWGKTDVTAMNGDVDGGTALGALGTHGLGGSPGIIRESRSGPEQPGACGPERDMFDDTPIARIPTSGRRSVGSCSNSSREASVSPSRGQGPGLGPPQAAAGAQPSAKIAGLQAMMNRLQQQQQQQPAPTPAPSVQHASEAVDKDRIARETLREEHAKIREEARRNYERLQRARAEEYATGSTTTTAAAVAVAAVPGGGVVPQGAPHARAAATNANADKDRVARDTLREEHAKIREEARRNYERLKQARAEEYGAGARGDGDGGASGATAAPPPAASATTDTEKERVMYDTLREEHASMRREARRNYERLRQAAAEDAALGGTSSTTRGAAGPPRRPLPGRRPSGGGKAAGAAGVGDYVVVARPKPAPASTPTPTPVPAGGGVGSEAPATTTIPDAMAVPPASGAVSRGRASPPPPPATASLRDTHDEFRREARRNYERLQAALREEVVGGSRADADITTTATCATPAPASVPHPSAVSPAAPPEGLGLRQSSNGVGGYASAGGPADVVGSGVAAARCAASSDTPAPGPAGGSVDAHATTASQSMRCRGGGYADGLPSGGPAGGDVAAVATPTPPAATEGSSGSGDAPTPTPDSPMAGGGQRSRGGGDDPAPQGPADHGAAAPAPAPSAKAAALQQLLERMQACGGAGVGEAGVVSSGSIPVGEAGATPADGIDAPLTEDMARKQEGGHDPAGATVATAASCAGASANANAPTSAYVPSAKATALQQLMAKVHGVGVSSRVADVPVAVRPEETRAAAHASLSQDASTGEDAARTVRQGDETPHPLASSATALTATTTSTSDASGTSTYVPSTKAAALQQLLDRMHEKGSASAAAAAPPSAASTTTTTVTTATTHSRSAGTHPASRTLPRGGGGGSGGAGSVGVGTECDEVSTMMSAGGGRDTLNSTATATHGDEAGSAMRYMNRREEEEGDDAIVDIVTEESPKISPSMSDGAALASGKTFIRSGTTNEVVHDDTLCDSVDRSVRDSKFNTSANMSVSYSSSLERTQREAGGRGGDTSGCRIPRAGDASPPSTIDEVETERDDADDAARSPVAPSSSASVVESASPVATVSAVPAVPSPRDGSAVSATGPRTLSTRTNGGGLQESWKHGSARTDNTREEEGEAGKAAAAATVGTAGEPAPQEDAAFIPRGCVGDDDDDDDDDDADAGTTTAPPPTAHAKVEEGTVDAPEGSSTRMGRSWEEVKEDAAAAAAAVDGVEGPLNSTATPATATTGVASTARPASPAGGGDGSNDGDDGQNASPQSSIISSPRASESPTVTTQSEPQAPKDGPLTMTGTVAGTTTVSTMISTWRTGAQEMDASGATPSHRETADGVSFDNEEPMRSPAAAAPAAPAVVDTDAAPAQGDLIDDVGSPAPTPAVDRDGDGSAHSHAPAAVGAPLHAGPTVGVCGDVGPRAAADVAASSSTAGASDLVRAATEACEEHPSGIAAVVDVNDAASGSETSDGDDGDDDDDNVAAFTIASSSQAGDGTRGPRRSLTTAGEASMGNASFTIASTMAGDATTRTKRTGTESLTAEGGGQNEAFSAPSRGEGAEGGVVHTDADAAGQDIPEATFPQRRVPRGAFGGTVASAATTGPLAFQTVCEATCERRAIAGDATVSTGPLGFETVCQATFERRAAAGGAGLDSTAGNPLLAIRPACEATLERRAVQGNAGGSTADPAASIADGFYDTTVAGTTTGPLAILPTCAATIERAAGAAEPVDEPPPDAVKIAASPPPRASSESSAPAAPGPRDARASTPRTSQTRTQTQTQDSMGGEEAVEGGGAVQGIADADVHALHEQPREAENATPVSGTPSPSPSPSPTRSATTGDASPVTYTAKAAALQALMNKCAVVSASRPASRSGADGGGVVRATPMGTADDASAGDVSPAPPPPPPPPPPQQPQKPASNTPGVTSPSATGLGHCEVESHAPASPPHPPRPTSRNTRGVARGCSASAEGKATAIEERPGPSPATTHEAPPANAATAPTASLRDGGEGVAAIKERLARPMAGVDTTPTPAPVAATGAPVNVLSREARHARGGGAGCTAGAGPQWEIHVPEGRRGVSERQPPPPTRAPQRPSQPRERTATHIAGEDESEDFAARYNALRREARENYARLKAAAARDAGTAESDARDPVGVGSVVVVRAQITPPSPPPATATPEETHDAPAVFGCETHTAAGGGTADPATPTPAPAATPGPQPNPGGTDDGSGVDRNARTGALSWSIPFGGGVVGGGASGGSARGVREGGGAASKAVPEAPQARGGEREHALCPRGGDAGATAAAHETGDRSMSVGGGGGDGVVVAAAVMTPSAPPAAQAAWGDAPPTASAPASRHSSRGTNASGVLLMQPPPDGRGAAGVDDDDDDVIHLCDLCAAAPRRRADVHCAECEQHMCLKCSRAIHAFRGYTHHHIAPVRGAVGGGRGCCCSVM